MAKISQRHLDETVRTAGHTLTINGTAAHITNQAGQIVAEGSYTTTGKLRLAIPALQVQISTITGLAQCLDTLKETNR